jgi:hypothetical protein
MKTLILHGLSPTFYDGALDEAEKLNVVEASTKDVDIHNVDIASCPEPKGQVHQR